MKKRRFLFGFTLVELLVVVAIIASLAAIGVPMYTQSARNARDNRRATDIEVVRQAMVLYRSDNSSYEVVAGLLAAPAATRYTSFATQLVSSGYLGAPAPTDPRNTSPFQYTMFATTTTFCVCAQMESSQNGNSNQINCSQTFGTSGTYYCARNP